MDVCDGMGVKVGTCVAVSVGGMGVCVDVDKGVAGPVCVNVLDRTGF